MIPKNLKVGDTFTDGGYTYRVKALCEIGYISEKIGKEEVKPIIEEVIPSKEEKPTYTKTQINRMPSVDLEKLCEELGLEKGTGTEMKKKIIDKLEL